MTGDRLGYVVVTFNQASGRPTLGYADLHTSLEDAVTERDDETARTAEAGRRERFTIAEVIELDGERGDA